MAPPPVAPPQQEAEKVTVPDVVGRSEEQAVTAIEALGLDAELKNTQYSLTLEPEVVRVQKGHYFPKEEWEIPRDDAALSIVPEAHPWEAPSITQASKGEEISLGEFLNREDALELMALLEGRVRVGSHSPRSDRNF